MRHFLDELFCFRCASRLVTFQATSNVVLTAELRGRRVGWRPSRVSQGR